MKHQITVDGNRVNIQLTGSIYVQDAAKLREELLKWTGKGFNTFAIEMRSVDYIDSSGLGVLVAINNRAVDAGGRVVLRGLTGVVLDVFKRTRLIKVFGIEE